MQSRKWWKSNIISINGCTNRSNHQKSVPVKTGWNLQTVTNLYKNKPCTLISHHDRRSPISDTSTVCRMLRVYREVLFLKRERLTVLTTLSLWRNRYCKLPSLERRCVYSVLFTICIVSQFLLSFFRQRNNQNVNVGHQTPEFYYVNVKRKGPVTLPLGLSSL